MTHYAFFPQGVEFVQHRQAELLREAEQQRTARKALRPSLAEARFFRLYHLRRLLFRFVPTLANRVAL